jgi:hypothetical protein
VDKSRIDSNKEMFERSAKITRLYHTQTTIHDFYNQKDLPCILLYPGAYSGVRDAGKED